VLQKRGRNAKDGFLGSRCQPGFTAGTKITAKAPFDPADTLLFEYDSAAADAGKLNNLIGGISLEQFQRYDRVRVTLGMTYTLRHFRVVTWRMIYPAHHFL